MTDLSIYLQQAKANEESAKIAQKDSPEWAIIMYFYAALHYVNDYALNVDQLDSLQEKIELLGEGEKIESAHSVMRKYVKEIDYTINAKKELINNYNYLFDESMLARYLVNYEKCLDCSPREHYGKYTDREFKKISDKLEKIKIKLQEALRKYESSKKSKTK